MPATTEKTPPGYKICRNWESEANITDPIVWAVDSRQGTLQGPLDFHFLRGKRILLQLDREQIGLLTRAGQLKADPSKRIEGIRVVLIERKGPRQRHAGRIGQL